MQNHNASTVVITGASSGIGRELALEMARRGHNLGLTARRLPLLEKLREEIHSTINKKLKVELAILDVCQTDTVSPALQTLFDRLGGVGHNLAFHAESWHPIRDALLCIWNHVEDLRAQSLQSSSLGLGLGSDVGINLSNRHYKPLFTR